MIDCIKCGKTLEEGASLVRVNEKGVKDIWECLDEPLALGTGENTSLICADHLTAIAPFWKDAE